MFASGKICDQLKVALVMPVYNSSDGFFFKL